MNNIELSTIYLPILDEVYREASLTSILQGDEATLKRGNNGEVKVLKLDMDGLGDFSRSTGYTSGSTSAVWETLKYDRERSQKLTIDRLDNEENLAQPFALIAGEFIRNKVVPETDAARIAKLASASGITKVTETLSTGANIIAALRACTAVFDENEVPREERILWITPTLYGVVEDLDTTKSKKVLERFSTIIQMPQTRMYTAIDLNDGTSSYGYKKGEDHYAKTEDAEIVSGKTYYTKSGSTYTAVAEPSAASLSTYYELVQAAGKNLNFIAAHRKAAVSDLAQYIKYFSPDQDQSGDSHVFAYRNNNLYAHVYENKTKGIYASIANS